jgi:hypothetical protein
MVTRTRHGSRWPADVASLVAGVVAPAIVVAVADVVSLVTLLLVAVWMVVPLHAGGRVLADVRYGLKCWSASRAGARHARGLRLAHPTDSTGSTWERANHAVITDVTIRDNSHRTR